LLIHHLASYVTARREQGFEDTFPAVYDWVFSQVGAHIEPHLKKSSPYRSWSMIHDLFKHSGITSFKTTEVLKIVLMKYVLNSVASVQPDNLKAGSSLLKIGGMDNSHRNVDHYRESHIFINDCKVVS
jgi:hypothetical protein